MFWCKLVFRISKNSVELEHECQSFLIQSESLSQARLEIKKIIASNEIEFENINGDLMEWKFIGICHLTKLLNKSKNIHLSTESIHLNSYKLDQLTRIN